MQEYGLEEKGLVDLPYILCVVFNRDGMGPRNGTQNGAPFKEEDWNDNDVSNFPKTNTFSDVFMLPLAASTVLLALEDPWFPTVNDDSISEPPQENDPHEYILSMLEIMTKDQAFITNGRGQITSNANDSVFITP